MVYMQNNDYNNETQNAKRNGRQKILVRTSWISVIGNTVLSAAKIIIGLVSGSLAVLGDGIDSATDAVISVIMIITSRIIVKPPTSKYVYGYEKAESIATKVLSLIILLAGVQMLITSVKSLLSDVPKELPSTLAIWVTVFSIIVKLLLSVYQYRQGKRTESCMLIANAKNMRNDIFISLGVLVGLFFTFILRLPMLDTVFGLAISIFIIKSGVDIFLESNVQLMDGVNDTRIYDKIFDAVGNVEGAQNPHRVRSTLIGNMYLITLDIEVDGDITLNEAHNIAETVEDSIKQAVGNVYDIMVHVEPAGKKHSAEPFGIDRKLAEQIRMERLRKKIGSRKLFFRK